MKKTQISAILLATTLALSSCGEAPKEKEETKEEMNHDEMSHDEMHADGMEHKHDDLAAGVNDIELIKNNIKVYSANIAKEFPDAVLKMKSPEAMKLKAGKQQFDFEVENYQLATQTDGAEERHCANSKKGQHIHFILNNGPYQAHYEPTFEAELMEGNNVVLAFLSRSYHESIKNGKAYILKTFQTGDVATDFDDKAPHLFYSRPKGTYKGEDGKKILLDFYLLNAELSETANKVKAVIDGTEFILPSWQPYFVEGLKPGVHKLRIMLVDADGNLIEGPFNDSGEREITIEA